MAKFMTGKFTIIWLASCLGTFFCGEAQVAARARSTPSRSAPLPNGGYGKRLRAVRSLPPPSRVLFGEGDFNSPKLGFSSSCSPERIGGSLNSNYHF
jgi:hypothetical protein